MTLLTHIPYLCQNVSNIICNILSIKGTAAVIAIDGCLMAKDMKEAISGDSEDIKDDSEKTEDTPEDIRENSEDIGDGSKNFLKNRK